VILKGLGAKVNWLAVNRQFETDSDSECGREQFGKAKEGERPPLKASTKQRLVKTEKTLCVL
jgi:hypothetical protein